MVKLRKVLLMGYLLSQLANCGSRKSDGSVNAGGSVYLYKVGTTQQEFGYADADCTVPISTTAGAIALDGAGKRTIYMKAPADVVVADSTGGVVDASLSGFNKHRAELVEVQNSNFTGRITDGAGAVSQGLGGFTDLDTVLGYAAASLGPNFQYLAGSGATARNFQDWLKGVGIFVTDYGAKCDGLTDDTVAVQKTINAVAALGGGKVLFPPGTCLVGTGGSGLTITHSGVVLQGAGQYITVIKNMSTTIDTITFNTVNVVGVRGMRVTTNAASSGKSVVLNAVSVAVIDDVATDGSAVGLSVPSSQSVSVIGNSGIGGTVGISATTTNGLTMLGGILTNLTTSGATAVAIIGVQSTTLTFDSGSTGVTVIGGSGTITFTGGAQPANFYQYGLGKDGQALSSTAGTFATIDLAAGPDISLTAAQAAVTLPALTNPPPSTRRDYYVTIRFINAAGAPVNWTTNAQFKLNTTIPTTDAHTILVRFLWDGANSKFREVSRADTAT